MSLSVAAAPLSPDANLFRDMLDRLPNAAYACDARGLITYFNAKAVEVWGRAPMLNHEDDRFCGSYRLFSSEGTPIEHDECWMALALQHRREYLGQEILIERPNASLVPVMAYATPLMDGTGELVAGINMLVNISERKRMERLLREANETKNQYMATLSEELRAQLAVMRQALEGVENDLAPEAQSRASIGIIQARMQEMGSLIEDLLDLPRKPQASDRSQHWQLDDARGA